MIFALCAISLSTSAAVGGHELEVFVDALLRSLSNVKAGSKISESDFNEMKSLCDASDDRCTQTVNVLIKAVQFINDNDTSYSHYYYPILLGIIIIAKFIIAGLLSHQYFRKSNCCRRSSKSDKSSSNIELSDRESFVESVKVIDNDGQKAGVVGIEELPKLTGESTSPNPKPRKREQHSESRLLLDQKTIIRKSMP